MAKSVELELGFAPNASATVPAIAFEPGDEYLVEPAKATPAIDIEPDSPFALAQTESVLSVDFETASDKEIDALALELLDGSEPSLDNLPEPIIAETLVNPLQEIAQNIRIPRLLFGLVFLTGIFIGSIALGLLIWSQSQESTPDQLPPDSQRQVLYTVANRYWQTADLTAATHDLAGWDMDQVLQLLRDMQDESTDAQERRHLAALADGLYAPSYDPSITTFFFGHPFIMVAAVLSFIPLLAAVGYAVRVSTRGEKQAAGSVDGEIVQAVRSTPGIPGTPGAAPPDASSTTPDLEEAEIIEIPVLPSGRKVTAQTGAVEGKQENESELAASMSDLASVFEDVDVAIYTLQDLAKGLVEVQVEDLSKSVQETSERLKLANRQNQIFTAAE